MLGSTYSYPGVPGETSRGGLVVLLLMLVFLTEFQSVFGRLVAIGGIAPDLVLAAAVAIGIFRGPEQGFWLGLCGGLCQDLSSVATGVFGTLALAKLFIGWSAGCMANSVRRTFVFVPVILICFATCADQIILAFVGRDLSVLTWSALSRGILVNTLFGVPLYYLVSLAPGGMRA